MHRIKQWTEQARNQKHCKFDDLNKIVLRVMARYPNLFPRYRCTKSGSKTVHHFNVPGVPPISLEKEHGSREFLPNRYKSIALDGLDALIAYIDTVSSLTEKPETVEGKQER